MHIELYTRGWHILICFNCKWLSFNTHVLSRLPPIPTTIIGWKNQLPWTKVNKGQCTLPSKDFYWPLYVLSCFHFLCYSICRAGCTFVFQGHYKEQVIDSNTNPSFTVELVQEGSWYRSETLNFNSSAPSLSTKIQREWSTCCIQEEWPLLLKRHILLLPAITPTSRIATLLPLLCTSNSEVYTVVIGPAQTEHFLTVLVNSVSWTRFLHKKKEKTGSRKLPQRKWKQENYIRAIHSDHPGKFQVENNLPPTSVLN
jgi:hypothetical protein